MSADRTGPRFRHFLGLIIALGCSTAFAQSPVATDSVPTAIRDLTQRHMRQNQAVGGAVAVVVKGQTYFNEAFGMRDREAGHRATRQTVFRLGSISKAVAGVIAAQMVREGKLDLDSAIRESVPQWPSQFPTMTLRQLLSHTAGIRHYMLGRADNTAGHFDSAQAALRLFQNDPLIALPGAQFAYSTHGFTLAGAVMESKGTPLADLIKARIKLPSLRAEDARVPNPRRSQVYLRSSSGGAGLGATREDLSWKFAGGGMESTALDLARFGDRLRAGTLGRAADRDLVWTEQRTRDGVGIGYGLGWRIDQAADGQIRYGHGGSQQGTSTQLWVDPHRGITVAVMLNTTGSEAAILADEILRLVTQSRQNAPVVGQVPRAGETGFGVLAAVQTCSRVGEDRRQFGGR